MSDYAVLVTDHAYWRAAERFPGFDTVTIEDEVRAALAAGRVQASRAGLGLHHKTDPTCLYAWVPRGYRIYALRHDENPPRFVVTTVLRRRRP